MAWCGYHQTDHWHDRPVTPSVPLLVSPWTQTTMSPRFRNWSILPPSKHTICWRLPTTSTLVSNTTVMHDGLCFPWKEQPFSNIPREARLVKVLQDRPPNACEILWFRPKYPGWTSVPCTELIADYSPVTSIYVVLVVPTCLYAWHKLQTYTSLRMTSIARLTDSWPNRLSYLVWYNLGLTLRIYSKYLRRKCCCLSLQEPLLSIFQPVCTSHA